MPNNIHPDRKYSYTAFCFRKSGFRAIVGSQIHENTTILNQAAYLDHFDALYLKMSTFCVNVG